ncbi:MAG: hypothetical protein KDA84_19165, partial [Planctomycetaceae bacterium]|nr:hypothetical protein [Planctomycetaceae bacterium]
MRKQAPPKPPMGRVVKELTGKPKPAYLWVRGDFRRKGPELEPAYLRVTNPKNETPAPSKPSRTELVAWLTQPEHPLTARV